MRGYRGALSYERNMKILFLDVEGVLNSVGDEHGNGATTERVDGTTLVGIDSKLLAIYKAMLARVDAAVVLSSSWRLIPTLHAHLKERDVNFADVTPSMDPALKFCRGHETQLWLDEHPEVTRYAILDDDDDMLEHQTPNFFQASCGTGLTEELAGRIVAHMLG